MMHTRTYLIFEYFLDLCFPPSTEARRVRELEENDVTRLLRSRKMGEVWNLSAFADPDIRALIHEAKYHNNARAHKLLATMLERFLSDEPAFLKRLWVPIPLSRARLRARGYNQIEKVLQAVEKGYELDVRSDVLVRTRDTRPQTELDRMDRHGNVANAFRVMDPNLVVNQDIVLLDDVTTTGATLSAAQAALLAHQPSSVTLLALAH